MTQPALAAPLVPDCTGVLVAGGRATRLGGIPKGLLVVDGEPIIARALRMFARLFPSSMVVANDPAPYAAFGAPVIPDLVPGKGAPGGLHAALTAATTPWVFTAGCDMPFLASEPIVWLASRRAGAPATAVVWRGRLEPLHAFWSRACLAAVERSLRHGDPSMWAIATAAGARLVTDEEWKTVDPDGRSFGNVNTPADAESLAVTLPLP
jgi:molybdopterin-guanine dinucleotide biosynthesis protein A